MKTLRITHFAAAALAVATAFTGSADARPRARDAKPMPPTVDDSCPTWVDLYDSYRPATTVEPVITLIRCPSSKVRGNTETLATAREEVRNRLDTALVGETAQLWRAAYTDLCAREMLAAETEGHKLYPAMAVGCAWHADQVDMAALTRELDERPAQERPLIAKQIAADIRTVHDRALAAFPKDKAGREWELFYDLPNKVRAEWLERHTKYQDAYDRVAAFNDALESGKVEDCAGPLDEALASYLHGTTKLGEVTERLSEPVGYTLADALARCHYYNERTAETGALVGLLQHARRQITLAEQIYYARLDALAVDWEKAKKFPNLVGSKLSSVQPDDLRGGAPRVRTKLDDKWETVTRANLRFETREGRVAKVATSKAGATIQFRKEKVPLVDTKCHETDRIDRIEPDGRLKYREECTTKSLGTTWSNPAPEPVGDAGGVAPGRFARVVHGQHRGTAGTVVLVTDGPSENARVFRLADVVLSH